MSTSVVVVACRRHPWLVPCLESVMDQADDVVVVDNGSPGRWAADEARRLGARPVTLERNVGFPGGVNAGLRLARGDVVALLNDDAFAGDGWLKSATEALRDPTVGAVAPKLLLAWPHLEIRFDDEPWFAPPDGRSFGRQLWAVTVGGEDVLPALFGPGVHRLEEADEDGRRSRWRWTSGREPFYVPLPAGADPDAVLINGERVEGRVVELVNNAGSYLSAEGHAGDYGFLAHDGPAFDEPADRFAACGAAMVVRAETLGRLGGFAGSFFAYYEDTDWCWRAQLAGLRVRYEPGTVVRHVRSVSTGPNLNVKLLAARNRLHCLARNAPL
ncbi:MAG TPA: glycosyltransferase, partial [Acidimicrobiia bacterium]